MFTKTPIDITVKVGSKARLECAAKGHPMPVIAWQKDGGSDFPAARERRMRFFPQDSVFFIVDVKKSDMGQYSCMAANDAGVITYNITLAVLEPPSGAGPQSEKHAAIGGTVALECFTAGRCLRIVSYRLFFKLMKPHKK